VRRGYDAHVLGRRLAADSVGDCGDVVVLFEQRFGVLSDPADERLRVQSVGPVFPVDFLDLVLERSLVVELDDRSELRGEELSFRSGGLVRDGLQPALDCAQLAD